MKITKNAPPTAPTDPRLVGVAQASMLDLELAVQVAHAPTTQDAWDELAGQQTRRTLVKACLDADVATTKGHTAVQGLLAAGTPVPQSWIERLTVLELERIDAIWSLSDHDALRTPPADVEEGDPSALASRAMTPAFRRVGELDAPTGAWYVAAMAEVDRHGPGWDTEGLRAACKDLLRAAIATRDAPAAAVTT